MSKYITTPLRYSTGAQMILANEDAMTVADIGGFGYLFKQIDSGIETIREQDKIGERLVACWNACQGINPEAVPAVIAALKELVTLKLEKPEDYETRKPIAWQAASAALALVEGSVAPPQPGIDPGSTIHYELLRRLPDLVRTLCYTYDAWIVGGAAKYMCGQTSNVRDWDVIVPPHQWPEACKVLPYGSRVNTHGGVKATVGGYEIDVWAEDLGSYFKTVNSSFDSIAVSPRTQQVATCSKR